MKERASAIVNSWFGNEPKSKFIADIEALATEIRNEALEDAEKIALSWMEQGGPEAYKITHEIRSLKATKTGEG